MRHVQGAKTIVNYASKHPLSIILSVFFAQIFVVLTDQRKITFNRYNVIHFIGEDKKEKKIGLFVWLSIFDHLPNLERVLQVAVALVPAASDLDQILGVEHCQVSSWELAVK